MFKKIKRQLKFKPVNNQRGSVLLLVVLTMTIGFALCAAMLSLVQAQEFKIRSLAAAGEQLQPQLQHQYAAEAGIARGLTGLQRRYADFRGAGGWVGKKNLVTSTGDTYQTNAWIDGNVFPSNPHKFAVRGWADSPVSGVANLFNPLTDVEFIREKVFDYSIASKQDLTLEGGNYEVTRWDIHGSVASNNNLTLERAVTIHGKAHAAGNITTVQHARWVMWSHGPAPELKGDVRADNRIERRERWEWYNPPGWWTPPHPKRIWHSTTTNPPNHDALNFPNILDQAHLTNDYVERHYGSREDEFNSGGVVLSQNTINSDVLYDGNITITGSVKTINGDVVSRNGSITINRGNGLTINGNVVARYDINMPRVTMRDVEINGNLIAQQDITIDDNYGSTDIYRINNGSILAGRHITISEDVEIVRGDIISTGGNVTLADANEYFLPEETNVEIWSGDILVPAGHFKPYGVSATIGLHMPNKEKDGVLHTGGVVAVGGRLDMREGGWINPDINIDGVIYQQGRGGEGMEGSAEFDLKGSMVFNYANMGITEWLWRDPIQYNTQIVDELTPRLPGTTMESTKWEWQ